MPSGAPDAVTQAANQQNGNRQAALDAIATGGRAGRAAYQAGRSDLRQAQDRAMSGMAADSYGVLNDPGSRITNATQRIGGGSFDAYGTAMGRLSSAYGANADATAANNSNYFAQIAASAPAYRQLADEQIAEARASWERQKAEYEAAQEASGGYGDMSKWELEANAAGLGEQMAGSALDEARARRQAGRALINENELSMEDQQLLAQAQADYKAATGQAATGEVWDDIVRQIVGDQGLRQLNTGQHGVQKLHRGREQRQEVQATPDWAWQRAAAQAMGVPEPLAYGLFTPPTAGEMVNDVQAQRQLGYLQGPGQGMFESPQAQRDYYAAQDALARPPDPIPFQQATDQLGLDPETATAIATNPAFTDGLATMQDAVDQGMPLETANAYLAQGLTDTYGHDFPQLRQILSMMYGHLLG